MPVVFIFIAIVVPNPPLYHLLFTLIYHYIDYSVENQFVTKKNWYERQ